MEANKQVEKELLDALDKVLVSAAVGDVETYRKYTVDDLSCFEWYVHPYRVDNAAFHLNLIETNGKDGAKRRFDVLTPRFQVYGDVGIVTYNLLVTTTKDNENTFHSFNETRVFVKFGDIWKMVHFHKSPASNAKF